MKTPDPSRRAFLTTVAGGVMAAPLVAHNQSTTSAAPVIDMPFEAVNPRIGLIGTGGRGTNLLQNLLAADAKVNALCDIVKDKAVNAQSLVEKAGQKAPELYTDGDHAFEQLVARDDLDLVLIATPWRWHTPMA